MEPMLPISALLTFCVTVSALAYIDERTQAGMRHRGWQYLAAIITACVIYLIACILEVY